MPAICTVGTPDSGHAPFAPTVSVNGVPQFLVNGVPAMTSGSIQVVHTAPNTPPHTGVAIGTSKLLINGQPAVMNGDPLSCGATYAGGDPTLNIT